MGTEGSQARPPGGPLPSRREAFVALAGAPDIQTRVPALNHLPAAPQGLQVPQRPPVGPWSLGCQEEANPASFRLCLEQQQELRFQKPKDSLDPEVPPGGVNEHPLQFSYSLHFLLINDVFSLQPGPVALALLKVSSPTGHTVPSPMPDSTGGRQEGTEVLGFLC